MINVDCLYVNGDSWVYGSELIDPQHLDITDHFNPVHESYRLKHRWPALLGSSLGLELFDGSSPGAGNDRILRTSIYDLSQLLAQGRKPLVVVAWSQLQRFELGKREGLFRSFVNPKEIDLPRCVRDIWENWSSDYSDVIRWVTQLISLHSFCRANNIPMLGFCVFKTPYHLLEQQLSTKEFEPYLHQLDKTCELHLQQYQFSLESTLRQYTGIDYGPGGHPLKNGQQLLSKHIHKALTQRFKINTPEAEIQLHS